MACVVIPLLDKSKVHRYPGLYPGGQVMRTGTGLPGDPLNIALVGSEADLARSLLVAGWHPVAALGARRSVRTNCRKNQDVYLYRTAVTPAGARERFLESVRPLDQLREKPCCYNALTPNCTTAIRHQHPAAGRMKWDWRLLVNGKGDELMYERHAIETAGLHFAELKKRSLIDPAAEAANDDPDFSARIREGRPGM